LKGERLVARAAGPRPSAEAIAWFERALAEAAATDALLQEIRAAACLHRAAGKGARKRLVSLVDRFDPRETARTCGSRESSSVAYVRDP